MGALLAFALLGRRLIDPTDTSWLVGDFVTVQHAWVGYRLDASSAWSLSTDRLSWPLSMHIALFDGIPILALPLKLINGWLPREFQYIGLTLLANAALQAAFAFMLAAETAYDRLQSWRLTTYCLMVAVLFVAAPVFIHRFFMTHSALGTHWPIIAALWLYLRASHESVFSTVGAYSALLTATGGVNPYIVLMVTIVYGGTVLQFIMERNLARASEVLLLPLPVIAALVSMVAFGFLSVFGEGVVPGDGYGYYSANALAPINPRGLPTNFLPTLPIVTDGQSEGYGYLGAGALSLIVVGLSSALVRRTIPLKPTIPLFLVAATGFIMALSSTITIGSLIVTSYKLPMILSSLTHFRASGRFIWLFDYTLLMLGALMVVKFFRPRMVIAIVGVCAALQILDLSPVVHFAREKATAFSSPRFSDPSFRDVGVRHDLVLMTPPWYCGIHQPGYPFFSYWPIARLAIDFHLKTNNFYSGRLPRVQQRYHCGEYLAAFPQHQPDKRTIYLFTIDSFQSFGQSVRRTHLCDLADGLVICRGDMKKSGQSQRLQEHAK